MTKQWSELRSVDAHCIFLYFIWFILIQVFFIYSPPGPGKRFTSLRALLRVDDPFINKPDNIKDIIISKAPKFPILDDPDGPLMTYLVGDLLVILGDGYVVVSSYTPYQTATTPLYPSLATDPIHFGTVFTTYSYLPPSPGMVGPSSMVVIVYSKLQFVI